MVLLNGLSIYLSGPENLENFIYAKRVDMWYDECSFYAWQKWIVEIENGLTAKFFMRLRRFYYGRL